MLVITIVPLTEDYSSAIMNTTRTLITLICVYVKTNIVNHPDSPMAITQVLALSPQNRLIKDVWIVMYQLNWMSGTNGMLNGLTGDLVDKRKRRVTLFILHPCAVFQILVPTVT